MTESTATADFRVLGDAASSTEAAVRRARRLVLSYKVARSVFSLSWVVWRLSVSIRRPLNTLRWATANLPVETDEDRRIIRELAARLGETAKDLDVVYSKCEEVGRRASSTVPLTAPVWRWTTGQMEDLLCSVEDTAETLALTASEPFAQLVRRELANARPPN